MLQRIAYHVLPLLVVAAFLTSHAFAQTGADLNPLEAGKPIEREIAGGHTHTYSITLTRGQFLRVEVEQQSTDVVASLFGPQGTKITDVDLRAVPASEPISYQVDQNGIYKIAVTPSSSTAKTGHYRIVATMKTSPMSADWERLKAEGLLVEAVGKLAKVNKESLLVAVQNRSQALAIWQKLGDKDWEANTLFQIGRAYYLVYTELSRDEAGVEFYAEPHRPFELAVDSYNRSLALGRELKNEHLQASILYWLGYLYLDAGANEDAIDYFSQALPIFKRLGNRDREGITLLNIGAAYVRAGKSSQSIEYNQTAAAVLKEVGNIRNEIQALNNAGIALGNSVETESPENFQKALDYFNQSLQESRAANQRAFEARALNQIAWLYSRLPNNEQKSLEFLRQSQAVYHALEDRNQEAWEIKSIAWTQAKLKDYTNAIASYQQALTIYRDAKNGSGEVSVLRELGDVYMTLEEPDKALAAYHQEIPFRIQSMDQKGVDETSARIVEAYGAIDNKSRSDAPLLDPDKTVERTFAPGDFTYLGRLATPQGPEHFVGSASQQYLVALKKGQFLRLALDWHGGDPQVKVYDPDNKKLLEGTSSTRNQGRHSLSLVAEMDGNYRIVVRAYNGGDKNVSYQIRTDGPRAPSDSDKARLVAEHVFAEGQKLELEGTPENFAKAAAKYEEAAKLFGQIGDRYQESLAFELIAFLYVYPERLNDRIKAIDYFKQAKSSYRALGEKRRAAIMLNFIATIYTDTKLWEKLGHGVYDTSLQDYLEALSAFREVKDREWEAAELQAIFFHYISVNERDKALDYMEQALALNRLLEDRASEAMVLSNFGVVYLQLGDYAKSLDYNERAAAIFRDTLNPYGEAQATDVIAEAYDLLGRDTEALESSKQSLVLYLKLGSDWDVIKTMERIGLIYQHLNEPAKAKGYFEQALKGARADHFVVLEAPALFGLGSVSIGLGEPEQALEYFKQALALSSQYSASDEEAAALYNIARIERDRGNLPNARTQIEAALKIVESLRSQVKSQELRTSYFATVRDYYDFYIDLLMRMHKQHPADGYDRQALQASERARARSLLETLAEAKANIREGVDAKLVERERLLQQRLNAKAQEQMKLPDVPEAQAPARAIAQEIESLTTELQQVEAQIRKTSPRYANLTQPQPLTANEIQTSVLDQDTLLLQYALGEDRSYLWAVTPTSITSYELPKRDVIETAARQVYSFLNARNEFIKTESEVQRLERITKADAEYPRAAAALSRLILAPVSGELGHKRLVIVSEGALQYIPFGALPSTEDKTAGNQPLIIDHEIISLPSSSTLSVLRDEVKDRKPAAKTVAILADPVFESSDERLAQAMKRGPARNNSAARTPQRAAVLDRAARDAGLGGSELRIPRLPGTRLEASQILSLVPRAKSQGSFDFAASRQTATSSELSQYRYVHFATHGFLDSVHPELSGIVLSMIDEKGNPQDGFLRAHEVFNLKLPAELVVLSACQTGLGKEVRGEGLVGLTRGFMYAGAPRVVVSLWSVDDQSTAELMTRFYAGMLRDKLRPAAALRAAQVSLMKEKNWEAPYYWAAFTLQGEWR